MSKQLPYFQWEPGEYLAGNIQMCSLQAQGLFCNIISVYWQRECKMTRNHLEKRWANKEILKELIDEEIIKFNGDYVCIEFLDLQYENIVERKKRLSEAGSKGARIKKSKATLKPPLSHPEKKDKPPLSNQIREDKIREDNSIDWGKLVNLFNHITGKKTRLVSRKAKKQIKDRLKEGYTKQDVVKAITNCSKDSYHVEENLKYLTLEFISRSDKFEKYSSISETPKSKKLYEWV